jgi:hypothetical protein
MEEINLPLNTRISYSKATLSCPHFFCSVPKIGSHAHEQRKIQMCGNNASLKN